MTEKQIWDTLFQMTGSEIFTAALMGNMQAESALKPNNLQNSYEKKLGFTDESYTQAIDQYRYTIDLFVADHAGYGLCQWTSSGRKRNLYNNWLNHDPAVSIGDCQFQLEFCIWEIQNHYRNIWENRKNYGSIREATAVILRQYERPADQSDANVDRRTQRAEAFYKTYADAKPSNNELIGQLKGIANQIDCAQGILDECMEMLEHVMEDLVK